MQKRPCKGRVKAIWFKQSWWLSYIEHTVLLSVSNLEMTWIWTNIIEEYIFWQSLLRVSKSQYLAVLFITCQLVLKTWSSMGNVTIH